MVRRTGRVTMQWETIAPIVMALVALITVLVKTAREHSVAAVARREAEKQRMLKDATEAAQAAVAAQILKIKQEGQAVLDKLLDRVTTLSGRIATLETEKGALTKRVSSMEAENKDLQARIVSLEAENAKLREGGRKVPVVG